jgi:hypothetical protein
MKIDDVLIIEEFLQNPNSIRERALLLNYEPPKIGMGWKGYRCLEENDLTIEISNIIKEKIKENNPLFDQLNLKCYFHYTIKSNEKTKENIHKDSNVDYAGVLYLTPNPQDNSGTSFYNDQGREILYLENIYNRFVFYPANEWHSLKESFGDGIENGRLTFTVFCTLTQKNIKTLL